MNRLKNHRVYLAGPIDAAPDLGIQWRVKAAKELKNRYGLKVFDPLTKPIQGHSEKEEYIRKRHIAKLSGDFDFVAQTMKKIRKEDLRATDRCDFGLFYMTRDIPHYGTMEEFVTMNRSKKPVLVVFEQGREQVYDWLFGMVPHEYFFDSFDDVYNYLDQVAFSESFTDEFNRWVLWEETEEDKLKDEILSLAQHLLCEWESYDGDNTCWSEFFYERNHILNKFKLLQEKTNA